MEEAKARAGKPLDGVRVVDATTTFAGPYATYILAQLGADVIKVERPPRGDVARNLVAGRHPNMSSMFLNMNHGKRSFAVDLKTPDGQEVTKRLLSGADVFVHNIRGAAVRRVGLDNDSLRSRNPSLVYCHITGFGSGGPYEERPAYDDVVQSMSGLASLQGLPSGPPRYVQSVIADKTVGMTAVYAILAALYARERTGCGERIEVPMYETMASYVLVEHMVGLIYDPPLGPGVYPRTVSAFRHPYRTSDGYISLLVYTDEQWERFFKLVGREDLLDDVRFASSAERTANVDEVYALVEQVIAEHPTSYWLAHLADADIPVGVVTTVPDLLDDPHLEAVGLFENVTHPSEGPLRLVRPPVQFGEERPTSSSQPAPRLGEHTRELLVEAGYGTDEVRQLIERGAVVVPDSKA